MFEELNAHLKSLEKEMKKVSDRMIEITKRGSEMFLHSFRGGVHPKDHKKLSASAPSIHLLRANIETEVAE